MRKAKPKKRVILPDPVFNDQKVSKFVNHLMYDGKKNTSYEIFYKALDIVKEKMAKEEYHPAGGGEKPSYRWCYLPGAYRDPSRPQGERFHEEHDQLRSQARWQVYGRTPGS